MRTTLSERFEPNKESAEYRDGMRREEPLAGTGEPLLRVVLYQPEIPQNTGNIARTCAATRTPLHLVEPLGFLLTDRYLKRAGLDYWPYVTLKVHPDLNGLKKELAHCRWICFSTHAEKIYYHFNFLPGDCLLFGSETRGLPEEVLGTEAKEVLRVPLYQARVRSLNLATTVGIVLFEALRQLSLRLELS